MKTAPTGKPNGDQISPLSSSSISPMDESGGLSEAHPFARHVNPYLADLLGRIRLDKHFARGKGTELYDDEGRRYLDCIAAYGALPFGFNPAAIWRALEGVRDRREPSFVQPSLVGPAGELAARLVEIAPQGLERVTFTNSGAEAIEVAIKLCRAATGRLGILSTDRSFHGKTLGALSATGNAEYQKDFGAPAPHFDAIPFGDAVALRLALAERPAHYAAFLVEPIQGEGGIVEPPRGYLAEARAICRDAGVLLVLDEIQSGLGRTGALFACEAEGVVPDVMALAKALGGGLVPIGAVLCSEAAYTSTFAMKHSSTFAGNALACRAGLATLELLTRDNRRLVRRVARNGRRLRRRLGALARRYPHLIAEIRGRGYMLGVRFRVNRDLWPDSLLGAVAEQGLFTPVFANIADFDPSLKVLDSDELRTVGRDVAGLLEPFVVSRARITSAGGQKIFGEFIALPWTAAQMAAMPRRKAVAGVRAALGLARSRGAQLVGLGAFTSIATRGGLDVSREGIPVTTGNSFTAVSSVQAAAIAVVALGGYFGAATRATIVGAGGAIGRAVALLLAENVGRLTLVGNPDRDPAAIRRRLLAVAADICRHLTTGYRQGCSFVSGSLFARFLAECRGAPDPDASAEAFAALVGRLERRGALMLTTAVDEVLPSADLVVTATSATGSIINPGSLRAGAVVCDLSRPANVGPEVAIARPDVLIIDGGIIEVPGRPHLGRFGLGPGLAYACMAETMLLALDGHLQNSSLGTDLTAESLCRLRDSARRHGFRVAQLRSFGRPLEPA